MVPLTTLVSAWVQYTGSLPLEPLAVRGPSSYLERKGREKKGREKGKRKREEKKGKRKEEEQEKNKTTRSIQTPFFKPTPRHHHLPKFPANLQHFTIVIHIVDFVGLPNSANGIRAWIDNFLTGKNIHVRAFKQATSNTNKQTTKTSINKTSINKQQTTNNHAKATVQ